jgi:hypothetical protein
VGGRQGVCQKAAGLTHLKKSEEPACGARSDTGGIPESSRRLSEATPPEGRPPGKAPRQGVPETTRGTNPLPPLCGVGCFLDRVPVVSLRSTTV